MGWHLFDKMFIFRLKYYLDLKYWTALCDKESTLCQWQGYTVQLFYFDQDQDHKMYVVHYLCSAGTYKLTFSHDVVNIKAKFTMYFIFY